MNSASKILDIAERRMRQSGYNAVSYRDIAADIGIKSASLHYHFPKKEDLGVSLVQRYSENFRNQLTLKTNNLTNPQDKILAYIELYRFALEDQGLVCLCAVLGAEAPGLPKAVTTEVRAFFSMNIKWLTKQFGTIKTEGCNERAKTTFALLEGSMIISAVNEDISIFNAAKKTIQNMVH